MDLHLLKGAYAIARFDPIRSLPEWSTRQANDLFHVVTQTAEEVAVICDSSRVPAETKAERGWRCLKFDGPLDFALVGILSGILQVLADSGVGVLAVSTFDTDYVLVPDSKIEAATSALEDHRHRIIR